MKKRILSLLTVLAVLLVLPASVPVSMASSEALSSNQQTVAVEKEASDLVVSGIMQARFENMLNHNFVYGDDFYSDRTLIENSILSLLDYVSEGEIDRDLVLGFIADMYGRTVDPSAASYDFLPASDGKFAVLPRGYSEYTHKIISVEETVAGYKVLSKMTINPHDSVNETVLVETVFVANDGSGFGYNIVSSVVLESGFYSAA